MIAAQRGGLRPTSTIGTVALVLLVGTLAGGAAALVGPVYALAGAVGLICGAALISSWRLALLGFVAVATLLPFGVVPAPIGGVRPTLIDVVISILLITWIFRLLAREDTSPVTTPVDVILALFLGVAVAAYIFGTSYSSRPDTLRQFLKLINSFLFFFSVTQLVRTRRDLEMLVTALIAGGVAAASIGILLYHLSADTSSRLLRSLQPLGYPGGDVLRYIEDAGVRTDTMRAIGTSIDPNVFGALLVITGGFAVGRALAATSWRERRWYAAGSAIIVYALLISLSRGSWLGFALAFGIMTVVRYRRALLFLPVAALPMLVVFWSQVYGFIDHFLRGVQVRDQATGMRLGEYGDALTLIQRNPWLGVGFGAAPSSDLYLGVSSTYLLIAEEMGLIGLLLYLILIGTVITIAVRGYRHAAEERRPLILASGATFCGVLLSAVVDQHFFNLKYQHVSALFALLMAVVVLSSRPLDADNSA